MKSKIHLIVALMLALTLSGGVFAYTYTTASGTIVIAQPTGDVVSSNATGTQPDWDSVLDDLSSENKTCGETPTGNLFTINPDTAFGGDLMAKVYLANTGDLSKAYSYLNMKLYLEGSVEAGETPNYRLLTLQNGEAALTLEDLSPISGTWTETSQADFADSTLNQVDTTTSPGNVILDTFADNVTDSFNDETKIASSVNVTVSGGQARLTAGGAAGTETLRPNAAGDKTNIAFQEPTSGEHWDKVDETVSDGDSTYVFTDASSYEEDLYNTADHSTGSGAINYVKVYMVCRSDQGATQTNAYVLIKTNGAEYTGDEETTTPSYATYSHQWDYNPQTSAYWTWDEIDALQIGVGLRMPKANKDTNFTQVYVEVSYTLPYASSGTITSVNLLSGETVISIDSFDYNASAIPSGTGLKVQFSQDSTNWYNSAGTPDGWDTLSQGTNNIDLSGLGWSGSNFYYHMLFTSDEYDTPVLDEISVIFTLYYTSGDLTSSAHDNGYDLEWNWGTISFTVNEPSATDINFQIRTAATEGGLSSATWYGPTGTGDYYQISGNDINSVHDGDRWVQYKAYFSGPGDDTPTFSDISIIYSAQELTYTIEIIGGGYCLVSDNTSEWDTGWTTTPELYCEVTPR
ncbi:hypothetical protein ACFLXU_02790 [Chloroflexota bacterium]